MKADAISIVEAAYDCESDSRSWFRHLLEKVAPKLDRGFGVQMATYAPNMRPEELTFETHGMAREWEPRFMAAIHAMIAAYPHFLHTAFSPTAPSLAPHGTTTSALGLTVDHSSTSSSGTLDGGALGTDSGGEGTGSEGGGGGAGRDGGYPTFDASGALLTACDDWFAALVACASVPAAAQAHDAPRFRQACVIQANLPGSTHNASAIEACAQALRADCSGPSCGPNTGNLPVGAMCTPGFDFPCQSGFCAQPRQADGGYPSCGVCAASIPVGQPCDSTGAGICVQGSYCFYAGSSQGTCLAYGSMGAPCSSSRPCGTGLYCAATGQCAQREALGAPCHLWSDCQVSLTCTAGVCSHPAPAGGACMPGGSASPCAFGFTCEPTTSTCVAASVEPGGACGSNGGVCLYGTCSKSGTCPALVPDGQPCPGDDTKTCDVLAECDRYRVCAIPGTTFVCQ